MLTARWSKGSARFFILPKSVRTSSNPVEACKVLFDDYRTLLLGSQRWMDDFMLELALRLMLNVFYETHEGQSLVMVRLGGARKEILSISYILTVAT